MTDVNCVGFFFTILFQVGVNGMAHTHIGVLIFLLTCMLI